MIPLWDEIWICTQHMKNITHSDVMAMTVSQRRYFLGLLTKDFKQKEEQIEEQRNKQTTQGSKGSRTTKVSGSQLKSKMKNGEVPLK